MWQSRRIFLLFITWFFTAATLFSQLPHNAAVINCTTVYFEDQFYPGTKSYTLLIYNDSADTVPAMTLQKRVPAFLVSGFSWDKNYWWQIVTDPIGKTDAERRKFSVSRKITWMNVTASGPRVNINNRSKNQGGLIMLDYARGIFTRDGVQVWAIPDLEELRNRQVRDLKLSVDNTLTFLGEKIPVEMDFEGNEIWRAPSPLLIGGDTITYHHDFKKLRGNRYFVLGQKDVYRRVVDPGGAGNTKRAGMMWRNDTLYRKTTVGLLLEFDAGGKLQWYWDSNNYHTDEDLNFRKGPDGFANLASHMNAFSVDEDFRKAYVGYRDLNRIVKIDIASGKVDYSFGESHITGEKVGAEGLFKGQHDATITGRKTLLVFNNNTQRGGGGKSEVLELKETPVSARPVWKFGLDFDTLSTGKSVSAGNVVELPNKNLLVCAGTLPRVFEVNKNKEVVWDAFVYNRRSMDTTWTLFPQYRIAYTPQLYFYHFVAQLLPGKDGTFTVEITNTGNAGDTYRVEILEGEVLKQSIQSPTIPAERTFTKKLKSNNSTMVRISSVHNRLTTKSLQIR